MTFTRDQAASATLLWPRAEKVRPRACSSPQLQLHFTRMDSAFRASPLEVDRVLQNLTLCVTSYVSKQDGPSAAGESAAAALSSLNLKVSILLRSPRILRAP